MPMIGDPTTTFGGHGIGSLESTVAAHDGRPVLVMLCNAQTPYRLALHLRIARELTEYRLVSIFTHGVSNSPWSIPSPPEIGPIELGRPGEAAPKGVVDALREYGKGTRIIRCLKALRPAAVVVYGYADLGRIRTLRWCWRNGVPAFLWADSNAFADSTVGLKTLLKGSLIRYAVSCTRGVMVCGRLGHEYFRRYVGDSVRSYFVPYEPDYAMLQNLPAERRLAAAAEFNLDPARRRIVYSGRLAPEKNVSLLIRAFLDLAHRRPEWDLVVLGDGTERDRLKSLVPDALAHRIQWLGFQSDARTVAAVYHNCHVLCLPSTYEPWAVVLTEAAATGLALVSSHVVGAAAEVIRDGVNGRTFISNQLDDLREALSDATDPAHIDRYRRGSVEVLAEFRRRCDPVHGLKRALRDLAPPLGTPHSDPNGSHPVDRRVATAEPAP